MVSGDTVKVRVPGVGVDRNGDPVTVTGITSALRLGRIEAVGGNFLEYQAYPRTVGTDEFTYSVVDSQGAFATGTVRWPSSSRGSRSRRSRSRTGSRSSRAHGDVRPARQRLHRGRRLGRGRDPRRLRRRPPRPRHQPGDGAGTRLGAGAADRAGLPRHQRHRRVARDDDADHRGRLRQPADRLRRLRRADDSGSVVVDVLEGAYDPDGAADDLEVVEVSGDPSARVVDGVQVRADRGAAPKVLPFEVRDGDGATAVASVYIPPTGDGLPYVLPGSLIELDSGDSTSGKVSDYIAAPDGGGCGWPPAAARTPPRRPP